MRLTAARRARTTLAALLVLLSWCVLSLNSQPAHADGALPNMRVRVIPYPDYHHVCVHGDASGAVVVWQLTISGGGTDGAIAPLFAPWVGPRYDECYRVWKYGSDFAYAVILTGVPAGSTTAPGVSEGAGMYLDGQDYYYNSG